MNKLDVLIFGETSGGALHPALQQLVVAGRKVVPEGGSLGICVSGDDSLDGDVWNGLGVDAVYLMRHDSIVADQGSGIYDVLTAGVSDLVERLNPSVLLSARTDAGSIVGARVAARHGSGFASDCVDLALNPATGRVAVTRPVHGGNALGVYEFADDGGLQVVSVRPGALDVDGGAAGSVPVVEDVDLSGMPVADGGATLVETVSEAGDGVALEQADIVVAGGRGLGGAESFEHLRELCGLLGAALGASRAACDAGWIDHSHQVGLTGKSISPTTYITVGISGASQHMAGCSSARNIVAINSDASANIFSHARFGVVGDWEKVVPAFIGAVGEMG